MAERINLALSVRAPWWWFILHGGKDIENREWRPGNPGRRFRGRCWLHASAWYQKDDVLGDMRAAMDMMRAAGGKRPDGVDRLTHDMLKPAGGCIVGSVEIVDAVEHSDSPWYMGALGLVLRNPVALPAPIVCKGALGFFSPPPDVLDAINAKEEPDHA